MKVCTGAGGQALFLSSDMDQGPFVLSGLIPRIRILRMSVIGMETLMGSRCVWPKVNGITRSNRNRLRASYAVQDTLPI